MARAETGMIKIYDGSIFIFDNAHPPFSTNASVGLALLPYATNSSVNSSLSYYVLDASLNLIDGGYY
jgi:hypothetical protein